MATKTNVPNHDQNRKAKSFTEWLYHYAVTTGRWGNASTKTANGDRSRRVIDAIQAGVRNDELKSVESAADLYQFITAKNYRHAHVAGDEWKMEERTINDGGNVRPMQMQVDDHIQREWLHNGSWLQRCPPEQEDEILAHCDRVWGEYLRETGQWSGPTLAELQGEAATS